MPRLLTIFCIAWLAGCGDDDGTAGTSTETATAPAQGDTPSEPSMTGVAGGVGWEAPEPFRPVPPSGNMRDAEYVFPEEEGEQPATLTVFFFGEGVGGSVRENITRWSSQITPPPGEQAQLSEREVEGLPVTVLDARGTYSAQMGPGRGGPPQPGQRMLGAIVEGPEGPVFFKMVGGEAVMERAKPAFDRLVASFHPRS